MTSEHGTDAANAADARREAIMAAGAQDVTYVGHHTLILGDCLSIIPSLGDFGAVVTDPPYESHMHAAKRDEKVRGSARRIRLDGHANPPPVDFDSIDGIREEAALLMCNASNGWVLAFCTPEGIAPWRDALEAAGARYKRACFWFKPDSAPQFNGQGPAMAVEAFVTAWCGRGRSIWNGGGKRNLWTYPTNNAQRHGVHPTEKPVPLMSALVADFTPESAHVLDPFMGSGTTGVAAIATGRIFTGIERDRRYYEIAVERMRAAARQPDFFLGGGQS